MSQPVAFSPEDEERIGVMTMKVLEETIVTHGDRTRAWAFNAVKLVARTTKRHNCFEGLFEAVMTESSHTKCCHTHNDKMPSGLGRANMLVLKLFRFPWLRLELQVRSTLNCRHPVDKHNRTACLNPYHYRRVELPRVAIPPIVVNKNGDYGEPPLRPENPFEDSAIVEQQMTDEEAILNYTIPNVTMRGDEIKILYERHAGMETDADFQSNMLSMQGASLDGGASTSSNISLTSSILPVFGYNNSQETDEEKEAFCYRSGMSSPASDIASPHVFRPGMTGAIPFDALMNENDVDMELMNTEEEDAPQRARYPDGRPITPIEPRPLFRSSPSELGELSRNAGTYECVEYEENARWLGLMYYEEGTQIGEVKDFERHHCLIDGYTSTETLPSSRFSIGFYNNPTRTQITSEVRALVGKGARLYLLAGEVYIENLCNIPVFVQSISANMKNGFQLNTVSKLPPSSTMKVFDMRQFSKQLAAAATKTYQDVYALSRMCCIRISFCKGWGEHYRRSTVLRSPVWFQAHLHNPMQWIDSVLTCMGAPPRLCSSRT